MKNQKKKRRILLSLLLICIMGVTLTASTYAWFTQNRQVTVNNITVNVASANGIQVSVDGINFKSVIANEDITGANVTYANAVNQIPSGTNEMTPVSTIGELDTTNGRLKMFSGSIEGSAGGNILIASQSNETDGDDGAFIAFDLFVRLTAASNVYLTSASRAVASGTPSGIENASRIAIVTEGSTTSTVTETIQGLFANVDTAPVLLWELNNDRHNANGVANAANVYGINLALNTETDEDETDYIPLTSYYGVKAPITAANAIPLNSNSTTYFGTVEPDLSTGSAGIPTTAYHNLGEFAAGITKIRVYMWVEGQDVDCENYASGGSIVYSLQFSLDSHA